MPKGNRTAKGNADIIRHYQFVKGQKSIYNGGSPDPPELKMLKKLTKQELITVGNIVLNKDIAELQALAQDKTTNVLHAMVAAVAARVISKGDMASLDVLLNRLIGKVKDEIHHTGEAINPPQIIVALPNNQRHAQVVDVTPTPQVAADPLDGLL